MKKQLHKNYKDDKKTFFWNYLQTSFSNEYWVTSESIEDENKCDEVGLKSSYTHVLKGVYQQTTSGTQLRLIKLSNNTKKNDWKGEYSDTSSNWDEDLKSSVDFENKQPGEFYVTYDEYLDYFVATNIGCYAPEFEMIQHLDIKQPKGSYTLVKMNIMKSSDAIFKITQPFTDRENPAHIRLVVCKDIEENKEVEENILHIDGLFVANERSTFLESVEELFKGTYYVFIELDDKDIEYCLTVISTTVVKMKTISSNDMPNFLEDMVKNYMTLKHTNYRCTPTEPDIIMKTYFGAKLGGYCVHWYSNKSKNDTTYLENFKYENAKEIEYQFKHGSKDEMVSVKVKPGEEVVRIVKKLNPSSPADMVYNNAFIYPDSYLEQKCLESGKPKKIKDSEGNETNI